jgi:PAS domain S-box-containing protein
MIAAISRHCDCRIHFLGDELQARTANETAGRSRLPRSAVGALIAAALAAGLLLAVGRRDYPDLHTILDTGMCLLSGVLALVLWDMGGRLGQAFPRWLAVSFAVTSLLEFTHVMVTIEWFGVLAPIEEAQGFLRPSTWPPAALVLPIGVGGSLWLLGRGADGVLKPVLALVVVGAALFAAYQWLPTYTAPTLLGITRPQLIPTPLLWAAIGAAAWRRRGADRLLGSLAIMAAVLFAANLAMLYSQAPHDSEAMVAHLGKVAGYLTLLLFLMRVTSQDMLDRIRAEHKLERARRGQEQVYRSVIETALDAFILMDEDGRIREWNPQAETMFGWRRADAIGMRVADTVIPAAQRSVHESGLKHFLATGEGSVLRKRIEVAANRRDGTSLPVELVITPIRVDERWAFSGFLRDISERQRAEAALRESEQRFRRIVDSNIVGVLFWGADGEITDANDAYLALTGYTRRDLESGAVNWRRITPPDQLPLDERALEEIHATGRCTPYEKVLLRKDGRPLAVLVGAGAFEGVATSGVAFVADLSKLKQAESQLHQAQKMESVGQLTGGVAHDFNNLLTVVIGSLDLALAGVPPEQRPAIDSALKAAERGAALVRQLLAFSRRQTLIPESLDFNRLAAGMEDLLRRTLGEEIEIEMQLAQGLWPALADRGQVENALLNLAINSRDAMPAGGKLTIETANVHLDEDYAARNAEVAPGDYTMLAVTDTGSGMHPEVAARAFEPFFTTKDVGKGTGLGLSMIYGFAKQSGGHLKIYSEVGHGTTIRLYLPRVSAAETAAAAPKPAPAEHPRGGETILVVEDDREVRGFVVGQLRDLGYRVIEAPNGREARTILESDAAIDLLLTDVVMPGGITGRNLADGAKARRPNLKTLFSSGYTENSIIHQGKLDPGVNFLPKPFRRQDLALKVRAVLDG